MYRLVESLCCALEINVTSCVNYMSLKKFKKIEVEGSVTETNRRENMKEENQISNADGRSNNIEQD